MSDFEKDYVTLIRIAGTVIIKTRITNLTAEDLLAEAFIKLHESKSAYSIQKVQNLFYEIAFKEKQRPIIVELNCIGKKIILEQSKVCSKCKEDKPISCFYYKPNHHQKFHSYCIDCNKKASKEG